MTNNKKNVLLAFGALAIVLVAVLAIWRPPALRNEDASGAIGAVQKHHQTQITPQDVVLGDEATKQEQAIVYGDLLNDSAKLQSISAEFGAAAANKADNAKVTAAAKRLDDINADLQMRYAQYAGSFVTAANRIAAKTEDRKLGADVAEIGVKLNTKLSAADMEATNSRIGLINVVCQRAESKFSVDAAAQRVSEAMSAMQSRSGPEAASKLDSAAGSLNAQNLGVSLANLSDALQAITLEAKAITAAQDRLAAKNFDAKVFSFELGKSASSLETRGLNNLAVRFANDAEMGSKLDAINAQVANAKTQSTNLAGAMANRNDNISVAMSHLDAALSARRADYSAKTASAITLAASALQEHLAAQSAAASHVDAKLEGRSAQNRQDMAKVVMSMRGLAARPDLGANLGAQTFNHVVDLQNKLGAKAQ